jgi:hypothetical protein
MARCVKGALMFGEIWYCRMEKARNRDQIRIGIGPGGREKWGGKSECKGMNALTTKIEINRCSARVSGAGVTAVLKSASVAWSPLQQMCSAPGDEGVDGADSWHPEPPGASTCTVANTGSPIAQAPCSKSVVNAANAATLTVHPIIALQLMCKSHTHILNHDSTAWGHHPLNSSGPQVAEFCPRFANRILLALAGGHLCPL